MELGVVFSNFKVTMTIEVTNRRNTRPSKGSGVGEKLCDPPAISTDQGQQKPVATKKTKRNPPRMPPKSSTAAGRGRVKKNSASKKAASQGPSRPAPDSIKQPLHRKIDENIPGMDRSMSLAKEQSTSRKHFILDSIGKYIDDTSTIGSKSAMTGSVEDDDVSLTSIPSKQSSMMSLGSVPPVRPQRNIPTPEQDVNPSLNLSMDLSKCTEGLFDDDGPDEEPNTDICTASDERWARFKLLGRVGLGEIDVSEEDKPLIKRNHNILERALRNIMAQRDDDAGKGPLLGEDDPTSFDQLVTGHVLDEVKETIEIATKMASFKRDPEAIKIPPVVNDQLRDYVTVISSMYRSNAFHNFQHASNVLNGVNKLIRSVATPTDGDFTDMKYGCGVAADPWTQFALVFSALIHDVDHAGVPNAQLIRERSHIAGAYKNKSVAEQNSIELAWNLLMEPCYKELRDCLFLTSAELSRFRGLVVTAVMATDIADKELASLRKGRAAEALNAENQEKPDNDIVSRKATFVLETLIQAADVSHTMSSFPVFKKWNHKLFQEMHLAYKRGRADNDPIDSWYKGEFGFFDFYIIPLARKLKECGVFERTCEDWVKNAMTNRRAWELNGEEIVAGYRREIGAMPEENFDASDSSVSITLVPADPDSGEVFRSEQPEPSSGTDKNHNSDSDVSIILVPDDAGLNTGDEGAKSDSSSSNPEEEKKEERVAERRHSRTAKKEADEILEEVANGNTEKEENAIAGNGEDNIVPKKREKIAGKKREKIVRKKVDKANRDSQVVNTERPDDSAVTSKQTKKRNSLTIKTKSWIPLSPPGILRRLLVRSNSDSSGTLKNGAISDEAPVGRLPGPKMGRRIMLRSKSSDIPSISSEIENDTKVEDVAKKVTKRKGVKKKKAVDKPSAEKGVGKGKIKVKAKTKDGGKPLTKRQGRLTRSKSCDMADAAGADQVRLTRSKSCDITPTVASDDRNLSRSNSCDMTDEADPEQGRLTRSKSCDMTNATKSDPQGKTPRRRATSVGKRSKKRSASFDSGSRAAPTGPLVKEKREPKKKLKKKKKVKAPIEQ